ncbi:type-2 ice-structuring protein-like [Archocentrus centrarchus]|uniref:type-2 ice-structuring protein-like n=1 Tax=Archocentrus centrarchus TaxID=63155 RepID=UPI0011EA0DCE|nr:type-2 ice-structuring protein-like [Archocentrus centrarchus]
MKLLSVSAHLCALMALTFAVEGDSDAEGPVTTVKSHSGCPRGWIEFNNRCFHYVTTRMTWANAEKNCLLLGGNLASVHNDMEYFEIQKLTATHGYRQAWIGGTDAVQKKVWFWSDGTPFHYSNWCPGESSNGRNDHCLRMNYSGAKCWDDVRCAIRLPSVCAINMECLQE